MPETMTPEQYLAQATARELNYAMQQVKDMQQQVQRVKKAAQDIIKTCDWLLTGDTSHIDEDPF